MEPNIDPVVIRYYANKIDDFLQRLHLSLDINIHTIGLYFFLQLRLSGIGYRAEFIQWCQTVSIEITVILITLRIAIRLPYKDTMPDDVWSPVSGMDINKKSPE